MCVRPRSRYTPITLAALLALGCIDASGQPVTTQLPVLKPGGAIINAKVGTSTGNALTVTQTSSANNRGLIEWTSFSIGGQAMVKIIQPNAQSVLVNRVTGDGSNAISASEIYGSMSSNGRVFLVNPAGIVFGAGAQVNVGSLVATTLDMADSMTANNYAGFINGTGGVDFTKTISANGPNTSLSVLYNNGDATPQIQVAANGSITLISRDGLSQAGVLSAPQGQINLTSAQSATVLPVGASGFVQIALAQPTTEAIDLGFSSSTEALGGTIVVGAQDKDSAARGNTINVNGLVSTNSATGNGGTIQINAGSDGSVTAGAGALISASSTATAGTGGQVSLLGSSIRIVTGEGSNPRVEADGTTGGGTVTVGDSSAKSTYLGTGTSLSADATDTGAGGTVALQALYGAGAAVARTDYGVLEVYGSVTARGGAKGGDGGTIQTRAPSLTTSLTFAGNATATDAGTINAGSRGAGNSGTWVVESRGATISSPGAVASANGTFDPTATGAQLGAGEISTALNNNTSVSVTARPDGSSSDVSIALDPTANIARTAGSAATTLTLSSEDNITIAERSSIVASKDFGPLSLSFVSGTDAAGSGSISMKSSLVTAGGSISMRSAGFDTTAQGARIFISSSTLDTSAKSGASGDVHLNDQGGGVGGVGMDTSTVTAGALNIAGTGQGAGSAVSLQNNTFTVGDTKIIGQASSSGTGVSVANSNFTVSNLDIGGQASGGTAVSISGSSFTTASGNIGIHGSAVRTVATSPSTLTGVDLGTVAFHLGTGSLTVVGRGDDANLTTSGFATGLNLANVFISAGAASTGRITLAGESAGGSTGSGASLNTVNISTDGSTPGNAATGANVVLGGIADTTGTALSINQLNVVTTGNVNLRPLGVGTDGVITEQTAATITLAAPIASITASPPNVSALATTAAAATSTFDVNADWLLPASANSSGISAAQGVVIGSSAHTGAIIVGDNALTAHTDLSLTLQNEGAGSAGIQLGDGNAVKNLALLTAGDVSQSTSAGIGVLQNLVIRGGAASHVNLNNANNQLTSVAFDPPASLSIATQGALAVGAATAYTYDAATNTFTPLPITNSVGGDTVLLKAGGDVTLNRSISMEGTGASLLEIVSPGQVTFATGATLSTGSAGRWRIWAPTVNNAPAAGTSQNLYGCLYGDAATCEISGVAISATGNQLLHPTQPTLTVTANPTTGFSNGTLPPLTYTVSGLVNGDSAAGALTGALGTAATTSSPTGTYAINQGSLTSPLGYNINFQAANLRLMVGNLDQLGVTREMLQSAFRFEQSSDVYGRNQDQPYICTAASVIRGTLADDTQTNPLASEWGKVRNQPQLSGCLNMTDGGQCSAF